eukprot:COSAG03_NODE_149_length_11568_cov_8.811492_5_plen_74_part_00
MCLSDTVSMLVCHVAGMPGHDVNGTYANTIGVQINGNDHYVVDTVVWQLTTLGIHVNGGGECSCSFCSITDVS